MVHRKCEPISRVEGTRTHGVDGSLKALVSSGRTPEGARLWCQRLRTSCCARVCLGSGNQAMEVIRAVFLPFSPKVKVCSRVVCDSFGRPTCWRAAWTTAREADGSEPIVVKEHVGLRNTSRLNRSCLALRLFSTATLWVHSFT